MSGATLISCCYCGAQDIFKVHKGKRRQLACLSCGAPMRKMSPIKVTEPVAKPKPAAKPAPVTSPEGDRYKSKYEKYKSKYEKSKQHSAYHRKRKKKKGWVAELWDDLDDIFDIEDWFD